MPDPAASTEPDLCVIGGGSAGHPLAFAAAALGLRVTVVDPRDRLGQGQAADLAESMVLADVLGSGRRAEWPALRRRIALAVADAAPTHAADRLRTAGVTVVSAQGVFTDPRSLIAGSVAIRPRRFAIATGAVMPPPPWLAGCERLLGPADLLQADQLPPAVSILSETPAGLEWAQALARLGCRVTLALETSALSAFDAELLAPVRAGLRRDGVVVREAANVLASSSTVADDARVMVFGKPRPVVSPLALDKAGVALAGYAIRADLTLRTSNPRIFALGDVTGPSGAGAALPHQVGVVLRAVALRQPVPPRAPPFIPEALRTDPPLAQVGTLRPDTRRRVLRFPLAETIVGAATGSTGLAKLVVSSGGTVLGAGIAGPGAADAIAPWTLAITRRLSVGAMTALPIPAHGSGEVLRRAALGYWAGRLRAPWVRRLIGLLRRLP